MGTHSCVPVPCTMSRRRSRTRPVILLKSTSQEPQSRSMLCLVRSDVRKGPGVSRYGSVVIGLPSAVCAKAVSAPSRGSPQQRRCLACEDAGLVDANHLDRGPAARCGNTRLGANTREVRLRVHVDTGPLQAAQNPATNLRAVLANAAAEHDQLDPVEFAHIRRHIVPGTSTEYLDRQRGARIATLL